MGWGGVGRGGVGVGSGVVGWGEYFTSKPSSEVNLLRPKCSSCRLAKEASIPCGAAQSLLVTKRPPLADGRAGAKQ